MVLQIGSHQFEVNFSYETLERMTRWRWEEVPIIGSTPLLQYSGKDSPTMTFRGTWFNYTANNDRVQSIEALADEAEPLAVTGDQGFFYGTWVITGLQRNEEIFRPGQHSAIRTDWIISMKYYGESPDTPSFASGSIDTRPSEADMVRMAANAARRTAGALAVGADEIIESNDDTDLSDLKTIPEYNNLVTNARTDKSKLERIRTEPRADVVAITSRLRDFVSIADGSDARVRNIDATLRKAESLPLVDTDKFGTLRTSMNSVKGASRSASQQKSDVEDTIKILSPVASALA